MSALVWGSTLLAAWVIVGFFLYVVPAVDQPERSDALVVLAPSAGTGRLELGEHLMSEGHGTTLVVSMPDDETGGASSEICRAKRTYPIICFSPDPVTTQGEARAIRSLSKEYGWRSLTIVTNDFHVTRARTIIERCYSYKLIMAAVRADRPLASWVDVFLYESGALVKAAVHPEC
ncbi:YdcF family protein [Arthrobacter sp. S1_S22]|nr:YdcF family protein [Arthrobacter sp. S1_S22]